MYIEHFFLRHSGAIVYFHDIELKVDQTISACWELELPDRECQDEAYDHLLLSVTFHHRYVFSTQSPLPVGYAGSCDLPPAAPMTCPARRAAASGLRL